MKRIRRIVLSTLLGAACAAHPDRARVAPSDPVVIAPDLVATCGASARDSFEYDPALGDSRTCRRIEAAEPELELDDDAPAEERARGIAELLAGEPSDPPVDQRTVATAIRRAATRE